MTDYLEEALEGLDTLVHRLQRAGVAAEKVAENTEYFREAAAKVENVIKKSQSISKPAEKLDAPENIPSQSDQAAFDAGRGRGRSAEMASVEAGDGQEEILWLPASSEGQRALSVQEGEGGSLPLRSLETAWMSGGEGAGQTPLGTSVSLGPSTAEEVNWAEQTDRVFRRDSRRYDGGFCLY